MPEVPSLPRTNDSADPPSRCASRSTQPPGVFPVQASISPSPSPFSPIEKCKGFYCRLQSSNEGVRKNTATKRVLTRSDALGSSLTCSTRHEKAHLISLSLRKPNPHSHRCPLPCDTFTLLWRHSSLASAPSRRTLSLRSGRQNQTRQLLRFGNSEQAAWASLCGFAEHRQRPRGAYGIERGFAHSALRRPLRQQ